MCFVNARIAERYPASTQPRCLISVSTRVREALDALGRSVQSWLHLSIFGKGILGIPPAMCHQQIRENPLNRARGDEMIRSC